jgi:hypothetical protein
VCERERGVVVVVGGRKRVDPGKDKGKLTW